MKAYKAVLFVNFNFGLTNLIYKFQFIFSLAHGLVCLIVFIALLYISYLVNLLYKATLNFKDPPFS